MKVRLALTRRRRRPKIARVSRRFIELSGDRPQAWIEVEGKGDQIVIVPDPDAPQVTLGDVERPGRRLTDAEIEAEFADIPVDRED